MIKCYKCCDENNNEDLTLEIWGASTKHPDSKFYFSDFQKTELFSEDVQIFQWLCECASKMTFPWTAKKIVEYALEHHTDNEIFSITL